MVFLVLPLLLLGISACFEKKTVGFTALGSFLVLLVVGCILYVYIWWKFRNGNEKFREHIEHRHRHAAALGSLADDLDYLKVDMEWSKNEIGRIKDYAGLDPTFMGMEEGRPVVTVVSHEEEDEEMEDLELAGNAEDDRVSLYESCQSRPWREVFFAAAGSIKSGLGTTTQQQ
jgi:sodium-dependent phosphate cotransporter